MKKNLSDYLVALIVIACSLVLLGALTVALSGYRLKPPSRTLQIDYVDITGIHLASELRYAGAPIGHVTDIRLLNSTERLGAKNKANAVRITVEINNDVPQIPSDSRASIDADTLLSEKFISLSAGSPIGSGPDDFKVTELANKAVIQGYPGGLDALLKGDGINGVLSSVKDDLIPRLNTVLDSAQKAVGDVDTLVKNANALVGDKGSLRTTIDLAQKAVGGLQGIEDNLDTLLKKAQGLVTDTDQGIPSLLKQLGVVMDNLKVSTTYLKAFTQQLGEKPNRVIFSGKSAKLPTEDQIIKSAKPVPATVP